MAADSREAPAGDALVGSDIPELPVVLAELEEVDVIQGFPGQGSRAPGRTLTLAMVLSCGSGCSARGHLGDCSGNCAGSSFLDSLGYTVQRKGVIVSKIIPTALRSIAAACQNQPVCLGTS